ncbi:MAG: hypothetical protein A3A72_01630 [Deltaproteobacteria bacterium RIFCSPLOWO2_01_FULL_38_9]|nr:MAG: hypothetical protein A3A72_01630 [Deltaproteobacteria bacterium RIFCSPLOWO2_01_FULL_38_9]
MKKLFTIFIFFGFIASVFAETSQTLPAGRFRARVKPIYAFSFNTQFDQSGLEKSLVNKFEKKADSALVRKISNDLANLMESPVGVASLGEFLPSLNISSLVLGGAIEYGITNDLTVGAIVPVISAQSKFDLKFNPDPNALASSRPEIRGAAKNMLQSVQDYASSKGYAPFENWDAIGLGDIELGVKYRLLNTELWTIATKSGVRLPTGRVDNIDHLTDVAFGDGQTDLGTTLLIDFKEIPNVLVNGMVKYTVQLPDREILRVPDEGDLFTSKKENLKRNLGDRIDTALYVEYPFLQAFNVNATYSFFAKQKDQFTSALGYNASGLEKSTNQYKYSIDTGLGFSSLPWFKAGTFSLPMEAGLNFELPLWGKNVAKATTAYLEYKLYF